MFGLIAWRSTALLLGWPVFGDAPEEVLGFCSNSRQACSDEAAHLERPRVEHRLGSRKRVGGWPHGQGWIAVLTAHAGIISEVACHFNGAVPILVASHFGSAEETQMTRTIKEDELHANQHDVLVDDELAGVIFHEPHAAQPGHRYEGKPYAAWSATKCANLPERYATLQEAADAIAPQPEPHVISVRGGKVHLGRDDAGRPYPLCRDNAVGMAYRETPALVTCDHCLGVLKRRAARIARENQELAS